MLLRVRRVTGVPSSAYVIEYDGTFTFPVPVAQLWATMVQVDRFSSWWSWLHEFSVEGEGLERGTVLHGIVAPPLPYRMRLDVVLDECVPERRITALVHGDLEGAAQLTFDGDDAEAHAARDVDDRDDATTDADWPRGSRTHCFGGDTIASSTPPSTGFAVILSAKTPRRRARATSSASANATIAHDSDLSARSRGSSNVRRSSARARFRRAW